MRGCPNTPGRSPLMTSNESEFPIETGAPNPGEES